MWSLETVIIFNLRLQTQQLDLTGLFDLILELPAVWKQRRWGMCNIFSAGRDLENKNETLEYHGHIRENMSRFPVKNGDTDT